MLCYFYLLEYKVIFIIYCVVLTLMCKRLEHCNQPRPAIREGLALELLDGGPAQATERTSSLD